MKQSNRQEGNKKKTAAVPPFHEPYYIHELLCRSLESTLFFLFFSLFSFLSFLFHSPHLLPRHPNISFPRFDSIQQATPLLTVLGSVTGETQGLVGHKLIAHRVESSTNGDTATNASAQEAKRGEEEKEEEREGITKGPKCN